MIDIGKVGIKYDLFIMKPAQEVYLIAVPIKSMIIMLAIKWDLLSPGVKSLNVAHIEAFLS